MERMPTLKTERLLLTPIQLSDAPACQVLFNQWDVVRYLNHRVPWPYPQDGSLTHIRDRDLPGIAAGTEWHWIIRLLDQPDSCLGKISLFDEPGNNRGFWLAPQWQGQGYMSEACQAVNRFWFETLERPLMQVPKAVDNHASRRISEREGMQLVTTRRGQFVCGEMDQQLWALTREQWLARQA